MTDPQIITPRKAYRPDHGTGVLASRLFVAIDLETTGVSDNHRIVEIGAVKMAPDGTVRDRFSMVVNPGDNVPLPKAAERVHGITPREIRSAPPLDDALDDLADFIGACGVVSHNLPFERRFLTAAYLRRGGQLPCWQGLCTLATARKAVISDSYSLGHLLRSLGLPGTNSHRAESDAEDCGTLAAYLISVLNVSALEPLPSMVAANIEADSDVDRAANLLRRELGATPLELQSQPPTPVRRRTGSAGLPVAEPPSLGIPASRHDEVSAAFGGFTPTAEQERALTLYQSDEDLKLIAVAGSGKTSFLLAAARLDQSGRPHRRIRYLAFGSDVAKEADRRFPDNTTASTIHALARRHLVNTTYGPLLGKLNTELPPWSVTAEAILPRETVVDLPAGSRALSEYTVGRIALSTLEKFLRTVDEQITEAHLPEVPGLSGATPRAQLAEVVVPCARRAWKHVLDPHSFAVRFTHDAYLKLFADMHPTIGNPGDALLFDEAQDGNPVAVQIVSEQTHLQRVYVGDSAQAIFRFTGAVDSLRKFHTPHTATLSQSFRFGDAIAEAANVYLRKLGERPRVRGNPVIDDVLDWRMKDATAVLARSNGGALAEVLAAQEAGKRAALIGDTETFLRFCDVTRDLKSGREPRDVRYSAFRSWTQLLEYVEQQPGSSDLATQTRLINERGVDVVESALRNLVSPKRAEFVAMTAHKSKGLEFDRVQIADDFFIEEQPPGSPFALSPEDLADEYRLAYVAVTRARTALNPGMLVIPAQVGPQRAAPAGMLL